MPVVDLDKHITDAQHRIEELYHETAGKCYMSFSGGKDSTVLLSLVKSCQELGTVGDIPAVFCDTGVELGVTVNFVKWVKENYYQDVQIIRPAVSFDWVLKNKGKPIKSKLKAETLGRWQANPTSQLLLLLLGKTGTGRFYAAAKIGDMDLHMIHPAFPIRASSACCDYLKKKPFKNYVKRNGKKGAIIGIRTSEGGVRATTAAARIRVGGKLCTWTRDSLIYKAPIIDWPDEAIKEYIKKYDVPLSEAYTVHGFKRTGCMACPFSRHVGHDLEYLFRHEPNRYKAAMHWLKDVYIAQNVRLPFDPVYERERENMAGVV